MKNSKAHYRKVFKSDHLGVADLEEMIEDGVKLVFTIKEVKQYILDPTIKGSGVVVAGKRIGANIAYFVEDIKPLVLNATNSKRMKSFTNSNFVQDWKNIPIELYADQSVKMKGEIIGGVRIKQVKPKAKVKKQPFTEDHFEKAKSVDASIDQIKKKYTITEEIKDKYLKYVTT